jgi:hypothetical protein
MGLKIYKTLLNKTSIFFRPIGLCPIFRPVGLMLWVLYNKKPGPSPKVRLVLRLDPTSVWAQLAIDFVKDADYVTTVWAIFNYISDTLQYKSIFLHNKFAPRRELLLPGAGSNPFANLQRWTHSTLKKNWGANKWSSPLVVNFTRGRCQICT